MTSKYDPQKHHRRSIRLKGYDYTQSGAYFVTICTQHMACLFGYIENDEMIPNDAGQMIEHEWLALAQRFPNIQFGEYVVMPNHFHAILIIEPPTPNVGAGLVPAQDVPAQDVPAQNAPAQNAPAHTDEPPTAGAGLVPAQDVPAQNAPAQNTPKRATTRVAPTGLGDDTTNRATTRVAPTGLGGIIGAFKSITTNQYINGVKQSGWRPFDGKLWQRNYYEHIIRNEKAFQKITNYIHTNPARWKDDQYFN